MKPLLLILAAAVSFLPKARADEPAPPLSAQFACLDTVDPKIQGPLHAISNPGEKLKVVLLAKKGLYIFTELGGALTEGQPATEKSHITVMDPHGKITYVFISKSAGIFTHSVAPAINADYVLANVNYVADPGTVKALDDAIAAEIQKTHAAYADLKVHSTKSSPVSRDGFMRSLDVCSGIPDDGIKKAIAAEKQKFSANSAAPAKNPTK